MNREIKFRCWDGEKMVTETTVPFTDINEHIAAFGGAYLMQFTGLRDKNGVEIYEGDLTDTGRYRRAVEWSDKDASFMLRWLDDETDRFQGLQGGLSQKWIDEIGVEVVGNIYETEKAVTV